MSNNVIKGISLNPRVLELAEEIKEHKGFTGFSELISACIRAYHSDCFPAYARRNASIQKTVTSKTEQDARAREERLRKFMEIAAQLDASPVGGEWNPVMGEDQPVTFFTYNVLERFEQQLPLSWLTPEHVSGQFSPSKEKVMALKAAGKTKW